jgi:hypothetical protein
MTADPDPVDCSVRLLRAARTGETETAADCWRTLAGYDSAALAERLPDDDARTAFWLNVYNAAVQDDLREDPERYDSRLRFFFADRVTVAGRDLSLNDIEHGLLRRRSLYALGYLPRLLTSRFERTHRVSELDPRIHFALNCGAASCPPIAAYTAEALDEELTLASESYLDTEVEYDLDAGVVRVPQLFLWYYGDFGGRSGTRDLLRRYGRLPDDATPSVRYRSYDWSLELDDFLDRESPPAATAGPASAAADGERDATPGERPEPSASSGVERSPSSGVEPTDDPSASPGS